MLTFFKGNLLASCKVWNFCHLFLSVIHNGSISVAFAAIAPGCTRFLCWIYGFVESISTGDHRQAQAGGTKVLEAALLMLPAGKCFRAKASGQNWEQRDPTMCLWWLFLVVASTKLRKSWQITNIALREKLWDFCTANSVSNRLRYLLGLVVLERKVLKSTAQLLILEVT